MPQIHRFKVELFAIIKSAIRNTVNAHFMKDKKVRVTITFGLVYLTLKLAQ